MPNEIDESVAPEPHGKSLRRLHEKHFGVTDFEQFKKRQEFKKLAEAARSVQARNPELIRKGPNPTLDWESLPRWEKAAYRIWWGEGLLKEICREERTTGDSVRPVLRRLEAETGEKYDWGSGRKKHPNSHRVE